MREATAVFVDMWSSVMPKLRAFVDHVKAYATAVLVRKTKRLIRLAQCAGYWRLPRLPSVSARRATKPSISVSATCE